MKSSVLPQVPAAPARRTGRPTRAETEQLNEHILDIAERHFLAHGFEGTSMDRLALEARASKRTIYHRYAGKHVLFEAVIERALDRLLGASASPVQGASLEARLEHLALALLDRGLRPDLLALMRVIIAEADRFPDLARSLEYRGRVRVINAVAAVLDAEIGTHGLSLTLPVEAAAEQFFTLTQTPLIMRALMGGDLAELRAGATGAVRQAIPLFLRGCREIEPAPAVDEARIALPARPRGAEGE